MGTETKTMDQMFIASAAPETQLPALTNQIDDQSVDLSRFDKAALTRINQIVAGTPRLDGRTVNGYALEPQARTNAFLDELLSGIRTADVGSAGALVAELASGVKMIDIPGMRAEADGQRPGGVFANIPLIGGAVQNYFSAFQRFRNNQKAILDHFESIETKGRKEMADLAAMDNKLDRMVEQNLTSLRELDLWGVAGQLILLREKDGYRVARDEALTSNDPVKLAAVRDYGEQINAFETRLMRIAMGIQDAMTNVPETRLTQSAGRIEYQNIIDTLNFDLPRLKKAILRVAALKAINDASASNDARRKLAQQTAAAGIEMLDKAYTKAKESQGGALSEIAAMGEIADKIVGIIDKGAEIDQRNQQSRAEAMQRLQDIQSKFVVSLTRSTAAAVRGSN